MIIVSGWNSNLKPLDWDSSERTTIPHHLHSIVLYIRRAQHKLMLSRIHVSFLTSERKWIIFLGNIKTEKHEMLTYTWAVVIVRQVQVQAQCGGGEAQATWFKDVLHSEVGPRINKNR